MSAPETASPPQNGKISQRNWVSLWGVLVVQAQNAFNDNLVKFVLIGMALAVAHDRPIGQNIQYLMSALLPLPFIVLAPISGFLSDRFSKRNVILWCCIFQLFIFAWLAFFIMNKNVEVAVAGFLLLSIQSTLFSPAKTGILKELAGSKRLTMVNGIMQTSTMLAILVGMFLGGTWYDALLNESNNGWRAAFVPVFYIGLAALVPLALSFAIQTTPSHKKVSFTPKVFYAHILDLLYLLKLKELRLTALGIGYYWFAASFIGLTLISFGKELFPDLDEGGAIGASARLTLMIGLGMIVGSVLVSVLSSNRIELGMIPIGSVGLLGSLLGVALTPPGSHLFYGSLLSIGVFGSFYLIPLSSFLQDASEEAHRGRVLSATNLIVNVVAIIAIGLGFLLDHAGFTANQSVLFLTIPTAAVALGSLALLPRNSFRFLFLILVRSIYRIKTLNIDRVPEKGGVLMISNHVTYVDAFIISAACPRPVRFVILNHFMSVRWMAWFLRLFGAIPITPGKAKEAIKLTAEAVKDGDVVCIFPEGQLTRTGVVNELRKGFELIARKADATVLPIYMDSLWDSIFSYEREKYIYKRPRHFPFSAIVNFGEPVAAREIDAARARTLILDLSEEAFAARPVLKRTLDREILGTLSHQPWKPCLVEHGKNRRHVLKRGSLLAASIALSARWKHTLNGAGDRVGVLLPQGIPAAFVNLALVLAGKRPVNLPVFPTENTSPAYRLADTLKEYGIGSIVTSRALAPQLTGLAEGFSLLDFREEMNAAGSPRVLLERILNYLEPTFFKRRRLALPERNPDAPAFAILSGESGPLVELSHRQVLANVYQASGAHFVWQGETILTEAPLNTAEGACFSLWYPVLRKGVAVSRSLSAHSGDPWDVLTEEDASLWILTKTSQKALEAHGEPLDLPAPFRWAFCFDENADAEALEKLEQQTGVSIGRGWAPDDLGIVISLSIPDPNALVPDHEPQTGRKEGSVGRLLPGISARIDGGQKSLTETGKLSLRGACLPQAEGKTSWTDTGRTALFDAEGFLFLEKV